MTSLVQVWFKVLLRQPDFSKLIHRPVFPTLPEFCRVHFKCGLWQTWLGKSPVNGISTQRGPLFWLWSQRGFFLKWPIMSWYVVPHCILRKERASSHYGMPWKRREIAAKWLILLRQAGVCFDSSKHVRWPRIGHCAYSGYKTIGDGFAY